MQVVAHRSAASVPAPYAAADAVYADAKAYLSSREAQQMSESDLERELNRRGQELMRKLLQGHLDQRSPGEAAGPVEGADGVERSERRLHDRQLETTFGTVTVERLGYARLSRLVYTFAAAFIAAELRRRRVRPAPLLFRVLASVPQPALSGSSGARDRS